MNIQILENLGLKEVSFDPGTVIIKTGQRTKNVYVLISGKVSMMVGGHQITAVDSPGTIFGEISALLHTDPVADVVTVERSSFYVVEEFLEFLKKNPEAAVSVAQILACRLINMNNHFVHFKEQINGLQKNLQDYVPVFPENYQGIKARKKAPAEKEK
ncbi:MAG: hypothetical protein A3K19_03240 [Lentisphaerae bacterium RIFOXYB12_FULL_65_16]|nr:MAG: hypothetical protein A3K18_32040 [Lentisphaerae bacterium RIFOXYA12_64_32]OGV92191.1 MAG: hypothetical protein A3K19_03240 [Lentisphaerae bacterium RIFOXYB12_FULL_65_16]